MGTQSIGFISGNGGIVETRSYWLKFDEPIGDYDERYYNLLGNFWLSFDYGTNKGNVEIPNCGGMADTEPKSRLQLDWISEKLKTLHAGPRWYTSWELLDKEAYVSFVEILCHEDALWKSSIFSSDFAEFAAILQHIYSSAFTIAKLLITNGSKSNSFAIDDTLNQSLLDLSRHEFDSKDEFAASLNQIFGTDQFMLTSKIGTHVKIK